MNGISAGNYEGVSAVQRRVESRRSRGFVSGVPARRRYGLRVHIRRPGNSNHNRRHARTRRGDSFGPYRILSVLGEGGMGTVYLAEQTEPIRRRVALKVVKLGMDTNQVLARFNHERQSLALMEHSNIARILDAGASSRGRPFFVMDYI